MLFFMDKKERLNEAYNYIRFKGVAHTLTDVADMMGSTLPNVSAAMNGKEKNLTDSFLRRFSKAFPDINIDWLLTGEGEMIIHGEKPELILSPESDSNIRMVPLINLDVMGGYSGNIEQAGEYTERMIAWENAHEGDFAVTTSGTSMMPVILPGSLILLRNVEGWREFLEYNILYVLELIDWRRLLKLVQKSESPKSLTLVSYNPNNPPQDVSMDFISRVFKVVSIRTNYGF